MARREYFPNLKGGGKSLDGLKINYLERFYFEGQAEAICYRTCQPSSRNPNARKGLKMLIELLPSVSQ